MNYTESVAIKQKIDSSERILVNCHHNPDADSVGSALAMARLLRFWKKDVRIICPTEVPSNLQFLLGEEKIETVDFSSFEFGSYDLFIALDSSSWSRVAGSQDVLKPDIPFVVIDHHKSNKRFGEISLIVPEAAANCEVLYYLFSDWGVSPDVERDFPDIHTPLLTGIIGDTGAFRFPEADTATFAVASELMKLANKDKIIFNLYQSYGENHVMVWRALLDNLRVDHEHKFVYSFIPKEILEKNGKPANAKSELADMLFQSIEGTDFGLVGAEDNGYISVSFRSRTGVDVSKIAESLGGGGHAWASAARVYDVNYDNAVQTILDHAREFAKKLQKA